MTNIPKQILLIAILPIIGGMGYIFWVYTLKDYLPTQKPKGYQIKQIADKVTYSGITIGQKPALLHFFNPDCPCSRFNLDHVKRLQDKYKKDIDITIVLQVQDSLYDWEQLKKEIEIEAPYLVDYNGEISKSCGVYSTPQAVLLTTNKELYYRGNYNLAKYCTNPNSNFAQMAIDSLLLGKPSPIFEFGLGATRAYGCQLPQNTFDYGK